MNALQISRRSRKVEVIQKSTLIVPRGLQTIWLVLSYEYSAICRLKNYGLLIFPAGHYISKFDHTNGSHVFVCVGLWCLLSRHYYCVLMQNVRNADCLSIVPLLCCGRFCFFTARFVRNVFAILCTLCMCASQLVLCLRLKYFQITLFISKFDHPNGSHVFVCVGLWCHLSHHYYCILMQNIRTADCIHIYIHGMHS